MNWLSFSAIALLCSAWNQGAVNAQGGNDIYKNALVYQIYPRSFFDSNGDGIGDLRGMMLKLPYLKSLGVNVLWLSPIFTSPQVDFGYDISNFTEVDKDYGTLRDFHQFVTAARMGFNMKVILDFVPNHSSDQHEWFKKSIKRIKPYDDYYIWRDAKVVNGTRHPPNNWLSAFEGSAWTWNNERKQYYLHQFAPEQPDLNYRNPAVRKEMKDVLTFWMTENVDGFRIDSMTALVEDDRFLDEPRSNKTGVPPQDFEYLNHIYTQNQEENYVILSEWRKLLDDFANRTRSNPKLILTEAYTTPELTKKYYNAGSDVPFNFMFINELNNRSTALDFKRLIDRWMNSIPDQRYVANWVVGNHDNHRAASRFGVKRADQLNMIAMVLPGFAVIYNGDEIGMVDRPFTYAETVDLAGCRAGPERYHLKSRDPERTPFQWDNTTSAGFSTNPKTWLPVHENYKTLNLEAQKDVEDSHFNVFQGLKHLKFSRNGQFGDTQVSLVTEHILAVVRRHGNTVTVLLVNFADFPVTADASAWLNVPKDLTVYVVSVGANVRLGTRADMTNVTVPAAASIVYVGIIPA